MKIVFLGTGTSMGVPMIGCGCKVCADRNPRNTRRRASILVKAAGKNIVIDTGPDFREQALAAKLCRLDAALLTHSHADHVCGFDDIRRFNDLQSEPIPVYGTAETLADLIRMFPYIRKKPPPGISLPRARLIRISGAFHIGGIRVIPLPVQHAGAMALGFRIEADGRALAYVPDCRGIPAATKELLHDLDIMILDALRRRPHPHHFTLQECVRELRKIGARKSFITHISHDLEHNATQKRLPRGIAASFDGLEITLGLRRTPTTAGACGRRALRL